MLNDCVDLVVNWQRCRQAATFTRNMYRGEYSRRLQIPNSSRGRLIAQWIEIGECKKKTAVNEWIDDSRTTALFMLPSIIIYSSFRLYSYLTYFNCRRYTWRWSSAPPPPKHSNRFLFYFSNAARERESAESCSTGWLNYSDRFVEQQRAPEPNLVDFFLFFFYIFILVLYSLQRNLLLSIQPLWVVRSSWRPSWSWRRTSRSASRRRRKRGRRRRRRRRRSKSQNLMAAIKALPTRIESWIDSSVSDEWRN